MSDMSDYRFVRNAEAWKQRVFSEDKAMLNFMRDYRTQYQGTRPYASGVQYPNTKRNLNYNDPRRSIGYSSQILPHLLSTNQHNNNNHYLSAEFGTRSASPFKYHTMQPVSPGAMTTDRSERNAMASARSARSNLHTSRSSRGNMSQRSGATSVNMMVLDEESNRRIAELEKVLEEERRGREEVQKELSNLKNLIYSQLK